MAKVYKIPHGNLPSQNTGHCGRHSDWHASGAACIVALSLAWDTINSQRQKREERSKMCCNAFVGLRRQRTQEMLVNMPLS